MTSTRRMNEITQKLADALALKSSYREVFGKSEASQRVLRHLCKIGYVGRTTFVPGDTNQTMLNEGMRRIVVSILKYVNQSDDQLRRQIEQAYKEQGEDI